MTGYDGKVTEDAQISPGPLRSDQQEPHPDLESVVAKHLATRWRKPVPEHTRQAFETARDWLQARGNPPLVLDSFCGTGMSTSLLAQRFPDHAVIGLDKSAHRLAKQPPSQDFLLLRAECEPFWLLLCQAGMTLARHYLLYPNPWPKASQLRRRVHGHPAMPLLQQLGGEVEMRSNWSVYAREFAIACNLIGIRGQLEELAVDTPLTLFEKKYWQRQQPLWRFRGQCCR